MYDQINPAQTFRERQLALLEETYNGRIARRLDVGGSSHRARSGMVALLAALVVGGLMLVALSSPAYASTTFTVNDTRDSPDASSTSSGTCDIDIFNDGDQCTLRVAIQQANATPGADTINSDIFGTGVKTIQVNSGGFGPLPRITDQVTIDGYTQTDASPNTKVVGDNAALKIELDGTSASGAHGLDLSASSGSVIKGQVINRFVTGIFAFGNAVGNRIEGNFIGTDPTGTIDEGNTSSGVVLAGAPPIIVGPSENVVGGTTPEARNVISGNRFSGVALGGDTASNQVQGNYIGTDKSGTKDLGNDDSGIRVATGAITGLGRWQYHRGHHSRR
jgi:hypothetical protein